MVKDKLIVTLITLLFIQALEFVYVEFMCTSFEYYGFVCYSPNPIIISIVKLISLTPIWWMPLELVKPSQFIYWMIYTCVYIPTNIVPVYAITGSSPTKSLPLSLVILLSFFLLKPSTKTTILQFRFPQITSNDFNVKIVIAYIFFNAVIVLFLGGSLFKISITDIFDIYDARESFGEKTSSINWINYIIPWMSNALNPLLMVQGMSFKKRSQLIYLILGILGQLFLFSMVGYKSVLFSSIQIVFTYYFLRFGRNKKFGINFSIGVLLLVITCIVLDQFFSTGNILTILFTRRLMIIPGLLTGYYFDFFSDHQLVLYSNGVFKWIIDYPYDLPYANIIGSNYLFHESTNANANFWADAFANAGYLGIIIFTYFLRILLWIIDSLCNNIKLEISCALLAIPCIVITNTGLLTSLTTHGILVVMLIFYFYPRANTNYVTSLNNQLAPISK